jgi:parallel beta-helix repeat protein
VLFVFSVFPLAFRVQPVKAASTIYVTSIGSVNPPSAPISHFGFAYTFTADIFDSIVIQRDNIVVDGAGHMLTGTGTGNGIDLTVTSNVTIKNIRITTFGFGIYLDGSSGDILSSNTISNNFYDSIYLYDSSNNNTVSGNNVTGNGYYGIGIVASSYNNVSGNVAANNKQDGIGLGSSLYNSISGNNVTNNTLDGIGLYDSCNNNSIFGNNITSNLVDGIYLYDHSNYNVISDNNITSNGEWGVGAITSSYNVISGNIIAKSGYDGIGLGSSSNNNTVSANNVTSNNGGIGLYGSSDNFIYHNNFVNNVLYNANVTAGDVNIWDNGYPSGGNYWSDYTGVDQKSGSYQNVTGSDGIGDTPYIVDPDNVDHYPLVHAQVIPEGVTIGVMVLVSSVAVVVGSRYFRRGPRL